MQQTIELREGMVAEPQVNVIDKAAEGAAEWLEKAKQGFAGWYDSESELYGVLAGEKVTWRVVVRIHLILVCMAVAIGSVMSDVGVALASMASCGWLVYRLNVGDSRTEKSERVKNDRNSRRK